MEKFKRSLFFWSLALAFFIVAPTVVLYAKGYRFDSERGVFVHSGTITLKTNPQSIDARLNGSPVASKKINLINNTQNLLGLLPRSYEITISAPGFHSWKKTAPVHSGFSSEFWNIVLVRENYEKKTYEATESERFFLSPRNSFVALAKNEDQGLRLGIFDLGTEKMSREFFFEKSFLIPEQKKENIEWSPQEKYLSIPLEIEKDAVSQENESAVSQKNRKGSGQNKNIEKSLEYIIVDFDKKNSFNLNEFLGKKNIEGVRWDPRDRDYLFFLEDNSLFRANVKKKDALAKISEDISAFDVSGSGIYFIKEPNNLVFRTSFDGKSENTQITHRFPEEGRKISRLIVYDESRIGFLTKEKELFVFNRGDRDTYFRKLSAGIEGLHFSDDGKKMLFWSDYEVSVYFLRPWEVQPVRLENDLKSITRYSEPIKNVQWFKDYEHIIFSTDRWIKFVELDDRDRRNSFDLSNTENRSPFVIYNNSLERLFFSEIIDGKHRLQSIVFPEPIPLLGLGR